ncbi:MAG TPA: universal stress protein [Solirubrobacteraceae bacterium]|nr:universal stress protein [Solirubrobacteraceae bacterium]
MPKPIIVGFDGSEHARDALALGRALAATLQTRLIVVNAYTPEELLWAPGTAEPLDEQGRQRVMDAAEAELSEQDRYELRSVASPSAAGALHAAAESEQAQAIVVGSTHCSALGRVLLGTVTQEALDAAPCAVLVAPAGLAAAKRPIRLAKIGVGFDHTPQAYDALAVARSLASRAGGELHIVWAAHLVAKAVPLAFLSYMNPDYFQKLRAEVEERLQQVAAPIRDELTVRTEIASGGTTTALIRHSQKLDLLVLGSRGYGPLERVLLGSVSRAVVNNAHCPVLVVPRGTTTLDENRLAAQAGESATAPESLSLR